MMTIVDSADRADRSSATGGLKWLALSQLAVPCMPCNDHLAIDPFVEYSKQKSNNSLSIASLPSPQFDHPTALVEDGLRKATLLIKQLHNQCSLNYTLIICPVLNFLRL
jgi:hypothetical protein